MVSPKRSQILKPVAAVLVVAASLVALAAGSYRSLQTRPTPVDEVQADRPGEYPFALQPGDANIDWAEKATQDLPFKLYKSLRDAIVAGEIRPEAIVAFDQILMTEAEKSEAAALLAQLEDCTPEQPPATTSSDDCDASATLAALYRVLITAEPNPDLLFSYLEFQTAKLLTKTDKKPDYKGRVYAWGGAYLTEAALTAYEATGQERFLTLAMESLLNIDAHRDDRLGIVDDFRGRVVKSWSSGHFANHTTRTSPATYAGRIAAPMARFALIVQAGETLQEKYGAAAEQLLTSAVESLSEYSDEFVVDTEAGVGYHWRSLDDRIEPLNHQAAVGRALLYVAAATGDPDWQQRAELLAKFAESVTYTDDQGYLLWEYSPTPETKRGEKLEPIWKAHVTVQFFILAEQFDVVFETADLEQVADTVQDYVFRSGEVGDINAMLSPQFHTLWKHRDYYGGYINLIPYLVLAEYDPEFGDELLDIMASHPQYDVWFQPKAANAYAYRLLEAAGEAQPASP